MFSFSQEVEEKGFAIVPDALSLKIVDQLAAEIAKAFQNRGYDSQHAMRHLCRDVPAVGIVAESAAVGALVEPLLGPATVVVRSLLFDKTPDANWRVAWHQDLTIAVRERIEMPGFSAWSVKDGLIHVQPPVAVLERMLTVRLHLDDCGVSNGPLQVLTASHKAGRLAARQISEWREQNEPVVCSVPRGGALLMRPLLLHSSSAAAVANHRRVIHLEFAAESLQGRLEWI